MIELYVNHDAEFEIINLVKAFFFLKKIEVKEKELSGSEIYIENIWKESYAVTKIVSAGRVLKKKLNLDEVDILENSEVKRRRICLRRNLYETISEFTGKKIEWGILTGVRPVKIIHSLFEKGFNDSEIHRVLKNQYMISERKIELMEHIGRVERDIIYPLNKDVYSLYIGIPFCPTRCSYCSFVSKKYDEKKADEYIKNLCYEIKKTATMLEGKQLDTVYIGGGTPTSLNSRQLDKLLRQFRDSFGTEYREFTVEAGRPDTIDRDKLEILRSFGVNRISINPQTMNDETLRNVDRDHNRNDIIEKYELAREVGFESINMDLIIGLPGEGPEEVEKTMRAVCELKPENLTVHTMTLKKDSIISRNICDYELTESEKIESMLDITREYASKMGLSPYYMYRQKQILGNFENIGYSLPGKESVYNIMMMEEKQTIIALGVGSVSKIFFPDEDRIERVPNFKDLNVYTERMDEMISRKNIYK